MFRSARKTIEVRGFPSERITLRQTVNGPIVSDVLRPDIIRTRNGGHAISLHSRILAPRHGGGGIADVLSARNWEEFSAAAADMGDFNLCYAYADKKRVGLRVSADVPQGDMATLRFPAAGWAPIDRGGVPTNPIRDDDLPNVIDRRVALWSVRTRPLRPFDESCFGAEYLDPARAERIRHLLDERTPHTLESFAANPSSPTVSRCRCESSPDTSRKRHSPTGGRAMTVDSVEAALVAATLIEYRRLTIPGRSGSRSEGTAGPVARDSDPGHLRRSRHLLGAETNPGESRERAPASR